jgi:hypothetical protein
MLPESCGEGCHTWLIMEHMPGDWCIVSPEIRQANVKSSTEDRPRAGCNSVPVARGLPPNRRRAELSCPGAIEIPTGDGWIKCKYLFMCRVNTRSIHHCKTRPCTLAEDANRGLHTTICHEDWFVNGKISDIKRLDVPGLS